MRRRRLIIIGTIMLVSLVAFFVFRGNRNSNSEFNNEYKIESGEVVSTINTSGKIIFSQKRDLYFQSVGEIGEVFVEEGEKVTKGQVIAKLDLQRLEADRKSAQAGLTIAQNNYALLRDSYNVQITELSSEVSRLNTDIAQINRDAGQVQNQLSEANAKIDTENAELALDSAQLATESAAEEAAQAKIVNEANEDLQNASSALAGEVAEEQTEAADIAAANAQDSLQIAEEQSENSLQRTENIEDLTISQLDQNNLVLEKNLEIAQKNYESALASLNEASQTRDKELSSLNAQIAQAEAALSLVGVSEDDVLIVAPFDGKLEKMPFEVGDYYLGAQASEPIIVSGDGGYIVEALVNELDILDVNLNQEAVVEIEADPSLDLEAKVVKILNTPEASLDGVVDYLVELEFAKQPPRLFDSLSVDIDLVTDKIEGAVQVPIAAVFREDGENFVNKKEQDGTVNKIPVEVGVEGNVNVEILSGVEVGDVVVY